MEKYIITGIYPDGSGMEIEVKATSCMDAFAVAQGLRKVTTLKETTVTSTVLAIVAKF